MDCKYDEQTTEKWSDILNIRLARFAPLRILTISCEEPPRTWQSRQYFVPYTDNIDNALKHFIGSFTSSSAFYFGRSMEFLVKFDPFRYGSDACPQCP
jgi:hypothetical protein